MSDIRFNRWLHQSGTGGVSQDSSGHIGIGTTVPTMALDVRGDVNIGNTININNASGIISATTFTGTTGTFSGNISAVDGTFTGDVTIAGTLTYEDVANIDAVGIITAQSDIIVGGGLTVTGISTFNNDVKLLDDDKLKFGIGEDLQIYHDGNHSYIDDTGTGRLNIRGNTGVSLRNYSNSNQFINCYTDGTVELFYDNSKKFETTNTGAVVTGILTATTFSGNLTGNVTGDLTGNLAGISSIAAISSSISDTAVDVFVYDTRKDSDGGAWRKRTQHTSWYNETLNTQYRGSRREFPAVAVIVAEEFDITIYDGDDPDLPMWMLLRRDGWDRLAHYSRADDTSIAYESLAALNGIICVGSHQDESSLQIANFVSDKSEIYRVTGNNYSHGYNPGLVGDTGASGNESIFDGTATGLGLVNSIVNDVAMTVLRNAPIDSVTGLLVPTIAVATNGGTSIIRDDGTIIDITPYADGYVDFDDDQNLIIGRGEGSAIVYAGPIPSADITETSWRAQSNVTYFGPSSSNIELYSSDYDPGNLTGVTKNAFSFDSSIGKVVKFDLNTNDANSTMVAYAATSYNTGWMHGDIKGAFLSDTDTTNATDSNVVTNGTFDSNTSGWSGDSGASVSWDSGGFASVGNGGGDNTYAIQQTGILVSGAKYRITGRVQPSMSGSYEFRVRAGGSGTQWNMTSGLTNGQWYSFDTGIITADGTKLEIGSQGGTITNFYLDDVYVWKLEEEDRSVNNTGLEVHGTITKSVVATGADLVGYSGFSNSNYLKQPYNSDLNFGTGNFSVTWWQYITGDISGSEYVYDRQGSSGNRHAVIYYANNDGRMSLYTNDGSTSEMLYDGINSYKNQWTCYSITRNSSGKIDIYINGELKQSTTGLPTRNLTNTSAELFVGIRHSVNTGAATQAKFALLRFSQSIPSAAQVKKMYEDEKFLFQENAKATLYGSSDVVTALGYDEDTELLHVGTSSGRSDFQGLRRINNTTTAVTTAISASDELIAEQ